jgi:hypothetical protein
MIKNVPDLKDSIAAAIGRLVSVRDFGEACVVAVPVAYPSGALAAVHISLSGELCFVSDCALGLREAEMSGATDFFDAAARDAAHSFGVAYDGASVFAASAPLGRIDGAIIAVANASATAVGKALLRASETKEKTANSAVYDLISDIFGRHRVARKAEIVGQDASWEAHNVVTSDGSRAIFEFVGEHSNSIASKFLMFSDLVRIENGLALNSVVKSIASVGPKGAMLSGVSNVIAIDSSRETFVRFAKAA